MPNASAPGSVRVKSDVTQKITPPINPKIAYVSPNTRPNDFVPIRLICIYTYYMPHFISKQLANIDRRTDVDRPLHGVNGPPLSKCPNDLLLDPGHILPARPFA
jgi:hypothetical protein